MDALGIILIFTGILVMLGGRRIIYSTDKMIRNSDPYQTKSETETLAPAPEDSTAGKEMKALVRRSMRILYIVGIVCILLGLILLYLI